MQDVQNDHRMYSRPVVKRSRRASMLLAVKLLGGAALALSAALPLAHGAAAEQADIVLTASASEVGASPGSAYALGYVAVAAAGQDVGAVALGASSVAVAMPDGVTGTVADTPMTEEEIGSIGRCHRC